MNRDLLAPWEPLPGEWNRSSALHLFRRGGFGASPSELSWALEAGPRATLERLFEDRGDPELHAAARSLLATESVEWLQAWWFGLILEGGAPARERLTLLWHDHFATSNDKVSDVRLMHRQNELFRSRGGGDFRELLLAVARDPAMLLWLDGDSNRRGHPNENFARELMELFALGLGHYDESDVREAARAFSGWGTEGRAFVERPEHHDVGRKTVLGLTGDLDGTAVIERVLAHPACARHLARTLLEAFVAPTPEPEWVESLAECIEARGWNVSSTLRTLLGSRLFFSDQARRALIAGPVELLAVTARTLEARISPLQAARWSARMGQALFRPPSVKGWDGGRAWIHSGTWIARHNALLSVLEASTLGDARSPEAASAQAIERLLPDADPDFGAVLLQTLSGADADRLTQSAHACVLTAPEYQLF